MGADLYIKSISDVERRKHEAEFTYWVSVRDTATDPESRADAQAKANEAFAGMFGRGYFRDSYNSTNLLWLFDLSWWQDVAALLDADDRLTPAGAQSLLDLLAEREPTFNCHLALLAPTSDSSRADTRRYFVEKYQTLRAFLNEAIARGEPIACSI